MTNTKDIVWLAGILEGEGCFDKASKKSLRIIIESTDLDVIESVKRITRTSALIISTKKIHNYKDKYKVTVYGNLAIQWVMTIYPLMHRRRREKIKELLEKWKSIETFCRKGHELTEKNSYVSKLGGTVCRACKLENQVKHRGY